MKFEIVSLLIAFAWISPILADEPRTIGGKTLDGWVAAVQARPNRETQRAIITLGYFGPEAKHAVPRLAKLLRLKTFEKDAIETLGRIGPNAAAAVPSLIEKFLDDFWVGYGDPRVALRRIGQPAVSGLIAILREASGQPRACDAVNVLGQIGPNATDAIPELIAILERKGNEPNLKDLKSCVILALGRICPKFSAKVPSLNLLLEIEQADGVPEFQSDDVEALAGYDLPPLEKLLSRDHSEGCHILAQLGPLASQAIPRLRKDLIDPELRIRANAAVALAHIDPTIVEAIPPLIEALDSPLQANWDLPDALVRFGPKAAAAIPSLIRRFEKDEVKWGDLRQIVLIDPEGKACIPTLIAGLKLDDGYSVHEAAECLSLIGPKATAALPALRNAVFREFQDKDNENPPVAALKALSRIDHGSRETLTILVQALKHRTKLPDWVVFPGERPEPEFDYSVPEAAAHMLGCYGPIAKSAAPALIEALQASLENHSSEPYTLGRELAFSLGRIGPGAKAAIPALRRAAGDSRAAALSGGRNSPASFRIDEAATIALVSIDPESRKGAEALNLHPLASDTVAALRGALGRPSLEAELILRRELEHMAEEIGELRDWFELPIQLEWQFERLSRFGFASRPAIPQLKQWQKHSNPWIRLWATEAIGQIP